MPAATRRREPEGSDSEYPSRLAQPTRVSKVSASRQRASKDDAAKVPPAALRGEATLKVEDEKEQALSNACTPVRSKEAASNPAQSGKAGRSRATAPNSIKQGVQQDHRDHERNSGGERDTGKSWLDSQLTSQEYKKTELNSTMGFTMKLKQALSSAKLPVESSAPGDLEWDETAETFRVAEGMHIAKLDAKTVLPILEDRFCLQATNAEPRQRRGVQYVTIDEDIKYQPFCADFGPFNLGMTHQFCSKLRDVFADEENEGDKIVLLVEAGEDDITNAIYLVGAFLTMHLGASVEQAWRPFSNIEQCPTLPYRDATWAQSSYDLHVTDCWAGLVRAREAGLYDPAEFREREYFYYDDPRNGDMHEVVKGKFIAFKGPTAKRYQVGHSLLPTDYADVFRVKGVRTVVRLNENQYDRMKLVQEGFHHHDLPFTDCSTPPDEIVDKFLRICEQSEGLIAVHCLAGLGRTGTLIAMYMMKHMDFAADEAMAWLRIVRPGSVIGPQQEYLKETEAKLKELKAKGVGGFGMGVEPEKVEDRRRKESQSLRDSMATELAAMVRNGMAKRDNVRSSMEDILKDLKDGAATAPVEPLAQAPQVVANGRRAGPLSQATSVRSSADATAPSDLASAIRKRSSNSSSRSSAKPSKQAWRGSTDSSKMPSVAEREESADEEPARAPNAAELKARKGDLMVTASREHLRNKLMQLPQWEGSEEDGSGSGAVRASSQAANSGSGKKKGGVDARQSWPVQSAAMGPLKSQAYNSVFGATAPVGNAIKAAKSQRSSQVSR